MNVERKSGILLHITSLPGPWGMGELGPQARAFGEFLSAAGQRMWQILPAGPAGYGHSPYSALSAFAGNHLLISFDELIDAGLLARKEQKHFPQVDPHHIDFPAVIAAREKILFKVADRFEPDAAFTDFCVREADWLTDFALFMAIRETQHFRPWTEWPEGLRLRDPQALEKARKKLARSVRRHEVLQYLFSRHWKKMRDFFQGLDIEIIGDIPIFVAGNSADVWANRDLFRLDDDGLPTVVAGVPPDYFSETGQRWGNPVYDWAVHRETNYDWWTRRMQRMFAMVDTVRIDHFRGFAAYWEIPADEPTAINGRWVPGPGRSFFQCLEKQLRRGTDFFTGFGSGFQLKEHVVAENLGVITDDVEALREACGFPGMWVLQFRFGAEPMAEKGYRPEGTETNWLVCPGTHDNDTTQSWFASINEQERHRVRSYLHTDGAAIHRDLCELALRAPADRAVLTLQDVLGLGGEARMNTPGEADGNWSWRFSEDMISTETVEWLKHMTGESDRA